MFKKYTSLNHCQSCPPTGGLEQNSGVSERVEKGRLHHDAAHDERDLARPPRLRRGHFLPHQQHGVRGVTHHSQPGMCVCVCFCTCVGLCLYSPLA